MKDLPVKIALAGVGNFASVFMQGLKFYSGDERRGLWHSNVAGLKPGDLQVVAAFDVDPRKVGLELSRAAFAPPNVARRFITLPKTRVMVGPGISKGDAAPHLSGVKLERAPTEEVARRIEDSGAEVVVNLISSGSTASSEEYARAALKAGCSFVNCTPALVLRNSRLVAGFHRAKLPLIGDDLMSQFGGTIFHKGLLRLMVKRGVKVSKSYQLDVGGGSETLNTIDEGIKMAKREVKTTAVASEVPYKFETIAGTTDFVDYMGNDRTSYFWFEGSGFMSSGISVDIYLRSSDGANGGNVLLDVIRATYRCMRVGRLGTVGEICAYGFKSPPKPVRFDEAYSKFAALYIR
ncbi:MAG: inositol-3-phosphate synthase [Nitrososphaerota archaeon]|nr:inositol-3-phosphate synthase [Nitrososphaerota archaeon]MDG7023989.1 inositol-3-phosphate synthase [Nitrososphaerota archaeon]